MDKSLDDYIRGYQMEKKEIISCMGVVTCVKNKQIYVALLKDKENNWILPKGHFQEGETYIETAIREVLEETHIKLNMEDLIGKIGEFNYFSDIENGIKNIKVYLFKIAELQKIIPLGKEDFVEGKWSLLEDAINEITYQEQRDILIKVNEVLYWENKILSTK